jgi:hypothetical protein
VCILCLCLSMAQIWRMCLKRGEVVTLSWHGCSSLPPHRDWGAYAMSVTQESGSLFFFYCTLSSDTVLMCLRQMSQRSVFMLQSA